jgi:hypothetical protein
MVPPVLSAQVWTPPELTAVKVPAGASDSSLEPQQARVLSVRTAHVCPLPVLIAVKVPDGG